MRTLLFTALISGIVVATGCNKSAPLVQKEPLNGVAVIDLDALAQALGSDKQIAASITQHEADLRKQLVNLSQSYSEQISKKKQAVENIPNPPAEAGVELASWQNQANTNLNKAKMQAERELQKKRVDLVQQFREAVKPVVNRVAKEKGLSVIVTKNDSVIYDFDASADITQAVIEAYRAKPSNTPKLK